MQGSGTEASQLLLQNAGNDFRRFASSLAQEAHEAVLAKLVTFRVLVLGKTVRVQNQASARRIAQPSVRKGIVYAHSDDSTGGLQALELASRGQQQARNVTTTRITHRAPQAINLYEDRGQIMSPGHVFNIPIHVCQHLTGSCRTRIKAIKRHCTHGPHQGCRYAMPGNISDKKI